VRALVAITAAVFEKGDPTPLSAEEILSRVEAYLYAIGVPETQIAPTVWLYYKLMFKKGRMTSADHATLKALGWYTDRARRVA
jgi:hypothetical protein